MKPVFSCDMKILLVVAVMVVAKTSARCSPVDAAAAG
jgi:hypothetical protein